VSEIATTVGEGLEHVALVDQSFMNTPEEQEGADEALPVATEFDFDLTNNYDASS
jgi:hypothetical protein